MMSLKEAAERFNKSEFTDTDGLNPFYGQVLPFTDNLRSGLTSARRILEVAPEVMPPEVVINSESSEQFILADPSYDFYEGEIIRSKYPIIRSESSYTIRTVEELLNSATGTVTRASVHYVRREPLEDSSINIEGFLGVLPKSVTADRWNIISNGLDNYRIVEDSYRDPIGLQTFQCIRVKNGLRTLDITNKGTYDPVTETYTGGSVTPTLCFVEEYEKSYQMWRQDVTDREPGDVTISTLGSVEAGSMVGEYEIISKQVDGNVNLLHGRRK